MQKTVTVVIECLVKLNGDRTGQGSQRGNSTATAGKCQAHLQTQQSQSLPEGRQLHGDTDAITA